jgi:two-component system sensor histidine kinase DesK
MDKIKRAIAGPWVPPGLGRAPYFWLLSLFFFLWKYVYVRPSVLELGLVAGSIALFLPLYLAGYWTAGARRVLVVLLTCWLGVMWAPHNFGASTFFIFAAAMCAGIRPERRAFAAVAGVLALASVLALTLDVMVLPFLVPVLIIGTAVGVTNVMEATLHRSRAQLLRKQEEVEHMATIAERERISRDLHDLLGHTLSLITLKAELAGKLLGRDEAACRQEVRDIEQSARHALSEVRSAVTGYRQTGFAHELASARASLAVAHVELSARVEAFALPAAAENVMSLALREAVTNIVRHAGATRCEVGLTLERGMIVFRIADNGAALAGVQAIRHGNGLTGMHERVTALGGRLALKVEQGLALELSLPMGAAV